MVKKSRRNFIQTSLSTAILTTASITGLASTNTPDASAATLDASAASSAASSKVAAKQAAEVPGPVMAYIRNIGKGEIAVLVGEQEIVYTDREFVQRLVERSLKLRT